VVEAATIMPSTDSGVSTATLYRSNSRLSG
jgi:hypothetical protein